MIAEAVVVCPQPDTAEARLLEERVAGLPLLLRTLLAARLAGIERFLVVASAQQQGTLRAQVEGDVRLRDRVEWRESVASWDAGGMPRLLLVPWVVVDTKALRRWLALAAGTHAVAAAGAAANPPLLAAPPFAARCADALLAGEAGWRALRAALEADGTLEGLPAGEWAPRLIQSPEEIPAIERAMIEALRSPEDGPILDRWINRRGSALLSQRLARARVTPNQITMASVATGLLGAWLLGHDTWAATLAGLLLFQASVILDHVDGEVARLKFAFTRLGKWLDNIGDHVVDLAVILFVAWRAAVGSSSEMFAALGLVAGVGVTGAFLLVFWWSVSDQARQPRRAGIAGALAPGLHALANRDGLCLTVWLTMLLGQPAWLLWTLAVGANVYWLLWLGVYGLPARSTVEAPSAARSEEAPKRPG